MQNSDRKCVRVGIIGYGTVGSATARLIASNADDLALRSGATIRVTAVCRRTPLGTDELPPGSRVVRDWQQVVAADDVDIVVETVGGTGVAREIVAAALERGKPVVTANKNLLAEHGDRLFSLAASHDLPLGFEAAVAGGIPVIRAIAEGTAADRLRRIYGVLNGTANYILSEMDARGVSFDDALAAAQRAGYAEPDPTFDVDGIDARDKLAIVARLAFAGRITAADIPTTGVRNIAAIDIHYARRLESTIRLVAAAERSEYGVELSVRPWLVPRRSMLAKVEGVNNAVFIVGEKIGTQMFYGPGAGGDATAVAVTSDVIEIASAIASGRLGHRRNSGFGAIPELKLLTIPAAASWFLRLTVRDRPGILAQVAEIIAREQINIDSVIQEPLPVAGSKDRLSFVITVEPVSEPTVARAVAAINDCSFMLEPVLLLRVE